MDNGLEQESYERLWEYLKKIGPHLDKEELKSLKEIFKLIEQDYSPVQKFGQAKLQFKLIKEENPYISKSTISLTMPENISEDEKEMLESFDRAKSHMELTELYSLMNMLSLITEHSCTIDLKEENGEQLIKVNRNLY